MAGQFSSQGSIKADLDEIVKIDRLIDSSIKNLKVISLARFKECKSKRRALVARIESKGYGQ